MAKLILSMDGVVLREIKLEKEKTSIGRKAHNDIQIDNLAVSGEHAVITTIGQDSFLEDLQSTNGTMVNGNAVQKHFLQDGDLIDIGKYKLKYLREAPVHIAQEDFEKTMVIRSPVAAQSAPAASPAPAFKPADTQAQPAAAAAAVPPAAPPVAAASPAAAAAPSAVIQLLNGPNAGHELALVKNLTSLGKPGVQVAVITKRPQGYFITHVDGGQYPVVNGKSLDAHAFALSDGDVIELAGIKMQFFQRA